MTDYEFDNLELEYRDLCDILGESPTASEMVGFDSGRPSCQLVEKKVRNDMAKYNIRLRTRLREYATKHGFSINVSAFLREQKELAAMGCVEPVKESHTNQTLSRFPEFNFIRPGYYTFRPSLVPKSRWEAYREQKNTDPYDDIADLVG